MRLADNKTVLYELSYFLPRVRIGYFDYLRGTVFSVETLKKNGGGALSKQKAPECIYMHGVQCHAHRVIQAVRVLTELDRCLT